MVVDVDEQESGTNSSMKLFGRDTRDHDIE